METEIQKYDDLKLVVIDTLQWFRPPGSAGDRNIYAKDYDQMMKIEKTADKFKISILVIHHLRKTGADDIFDRLSGSFGLTGVADGILVLNRKGKQYVLHTRGRDIQEKEVCSRI